MTSLVPPPPRGQHSLCIDCSKSPRICKEHLAGVKSSEVSLCVASHPSSLSASPKRRLPGASVPSADRAAALLLLASDAWVGVSRRLRTPPSTVLTGGLRATRPKILPEKQSRTKKVEKERVDENWG